MTTAEIKHSINITIKRDDLLIFYSLDDVVRNFFFKYIYLYSICVSKNRHSKTVMVLLSYEITEIIILFKIICEGQTVLNIDTKN